jgi:FtsH-binding integral membrane protein
MTLTGKRASATGAEPAHWLSPIDSPTNQPKETTQMYVRFISWLTTAIAAAFLVVATAAFGLSTVQWLAFGVGIGTLTVSIGLSVRYRRHLPTVSPAALSAIVSAWTVLASLIFAPTTVQPLALAGGLAIAGLAIIGLGSHELSSERVVHSLEVGKAQRESDYAMS